MKPTVEHAGGATVEVMMKTTFGGGELEDIVNIFPGAPLHQ